MYRKKKDRILSMILALALSASFLGGWQADSAQETGAVSESEEAFESDTLFTEENQPEALAAETEDTGLEIQRKETENTEGTKATGAETGTMSASEAENADTGEKETDRVAAADRTAEADRTSAADAGESEEKQTDKAAVSSETEGAGETSAANAGGTEEEQTDKAAVSSETEDIGETSAANAGGTEEEQADKAAVSSEAEDTGETSAANAGGTEEEQTDKTVGFSETENAGETTAPGGGKSAATETGVPAETEETIAEETDALAGETGASTEETDASAEQTDALEFDTGIYMGGWMNADSGSLEGAARLFLYEDGTALFSEDGKQVDGGGWQAMPDGLRLTMQSRIKGAYEMDVVYENGLLMLREGPGSFRMSRTADSRLTVTAEGTAILQGEAYQPETGKNLGFSADFYAIRVEETDVNPEKAGKYKTIYSLTDFLTGRSFAVEQPVTVLAVQPEQPTESGETEQPELPLAREETEMSESAETEASVSLSENAETEVTERPAEDAETAVPEQPAEKIHRPDTGEESYTKTFRVTTKGGVLRVLGSSRRLLAELAYGDADFVLHFPEDGEKNAEDITVQAVAEDGYTVKNYVIVTEDSGTSVTSPASVYGIGEQTYSRAHYLTQTPKNEVFKVSFEKQGIHSLFAVRTALPAASGNIDSPAVGDTFTGRATLTSINSPAGKTYNGTGVITCTSGDFEGDSFQMYACASGHTHAIPLRGQTGSYTLTITAVDKSAGKISYSIYWANDNEPSGYQDLSSSGSYSHSFEARIKATKVTKDGFDVSVSSEYTLKGAEFTLYRNYDPASGKLSGKIGVMTTGSSGKTSISSAITAEAGTYYIKETKAPQGFLLNSKVYTVTAQAGVTNVTEIPDDEKYGTILIQKVDEDTGKPDASLKGAKFTISSDEAGENVLETLIIDETGQAESKNQYLLGVAYYVKEIFAPAGWNIDEEAKEVTAVDDGTDEPSVTVKFRDSKQEGGIAVQKVSGRNGKSKPLNEEYSFKGAMFTIYRDKDCTDRVGSITTDENGYGKKTGLEVGTYYVKETRAPLSGNYEINDTVYPVEVGGTMLVRVKIREDEVLTHFTIQKVDEKTGKADPGLKGTTFGVFSDRACTDKLETVTVGADGIGTTGDYYYLGKTYYVKELSAPAGWLMDTGVKAVKATDAVKVPSLTFENTNPKGKIQVQKTVSDENYIKMYPLTGAVYTIYSDAELKTAAGTMTTDAKGRAVSGELPLGSYWVKETKTPVSGGYELDTKVYPVQITLQNYSDPIAVSSQEPSTTGSIVIEKHDSETKTSVPANEKYSLDGAVYTVYRDAQLSQTAGTIRILNGTGTLGGLPYGIYYVKETQAPADYHLDTRVYTAKVDSKDPVKILSEDPVKKGQIRIEKRDAVTGTGTSANQKYSLDGAVYAIYTDEACTKRLQELTIKNGSAQTEKTLLFGDYWVKETKAPDGYELDAKIYKVTIDSETCQEISAAAGTLIVSSEQPRRGAIGIEKRDSATGTGQPLNENYSLDGAVYGVFADADCTEKLRELTIENGRARTEKEFLFGDYWVKELKAPDGYELDAKIYKVTIDSETCQEISAAAGTLIVSSEQPKYGAIEIEKRDARTGTSKPVNDRYVLDGAVYTIFGDADCTEKLQELTIKDGRARTERNLPFGEYWVKETAAPKDYELDTAVYRVVIDSETCEEISAAKGTLVISAEAPKRGAVGIEKHDTETGTVKETNANYTMDGAVYTIYSDEGCTAEVTRLTIENGRAQTGKELLFGDYWIKETTPPAYYEADAGVYKVTIDSENCETVSLENGTLVLSADTPKRARLAVQKRDAETGETSPYTEALSFAGAEFGIYRDKDCTELIQSLVTDESGYAVSEELLIDTYYIREITAPEGYNRNPKIFAVAPEQMKEALDKDEAQAVVITDVEQEIIRANVLLMKYINDDDGSTIQRPQDRDLSGIRFTFTYVEDESVTFDVCGEKNTIITDENGVAVTEDREKYPRGTLIYGTWRIAEIPNSGLLEPIRDFEIQVTEEGGIYPYVANNDTVQARVEIQKRDANTGELIPLSDVSFRIRDEKGDLIEMWDPALGAYTDVFRTDDKGTVRLPNTLFYGSYTLEEIAAPDGYLLSEPVSFSVEEAHRNPLEPLIVECFDQPQTGKIEVTKVDQDTDENAGEGFAFEIVAAEDILDAAGNPRTGENALGETVELTKGTVVDSIITDKEGRAASKELYLGSYLVREIAAPDFYTVNETEQMVVLAADTSAEIVWAKVKAADVKTRIELTKVDAYNGMKALPGITFRVFPETLLEEITAGRLDLPAAGREYTTDARGRVRIEDLNHDTTYCIVETHTLDGYNLDPTVYRIYVDEKGLIGGEKTHVMTIANTPNVVEITKTDITGETELEGARLEITDADGNIVDEWISDGTPHVILGMKAGDYTLTETQAPEGYARAESVSFTVTDKLEVQSVTMKDERITVEVVKLDAETGQPVSGAKLMVSDSSGGIVEEWVTDETPHRMFLAAGDYVLSETQAPEGYAAAEPKAFTVTDERGVQTIELEDAPLSLVISKQGEEPDAELPGARLQLLDARGVEIAAWTTAEQPHTIKYLPKGSYTLRELAAPEGYSLAADLTFILEDTAKPQYVTMQNTKTQTEITKTDFATGEELPGAELVITDAEGNEIERWVSTEEPHKISGLPVGEYTLTETIAPEGYATAESVKFTVTDTGEIQKVEMKDQPLEVEISKTDIATGEELPGAELVITDAEGKEIERWVSTEKPHKISGLPVGEYTLTETIAPEGYATAESVKFTVTDTREIQKVEMKDELIQVEVAKRDAKTAEFLAGAKLEIRGIDGKTVESWTSQEKMYVIEGLPAGDYTLVETEAPEGYEKAAELAFTVKDTGEIQTVTLYNKKYPETHETEGPSGPAPETGDPSQTAVYGAALLAAALLAGMLLYRTWKVRRDGKDKV